ncbi:MAG: hypothetical protein ACRDE9_04585 [Candidatus Limnocylindria bacterium]
MTHRRISTFALAAALWLATAAVASANSTLHVSGSFAPTAEETCSGFNQTGMVLRFHCEDAVESWVGDISGTGTAFFDVTLNLATGRFVERGSEVLDGCVGTHCGTLAWDYVGIGTVDFATGNVTFHGVNQITGGTGDLLGASGAVQFAGNGVDPATYEGRISL